MLLNYLYEKNSNFFKSDLFNKEELMILQAIITKYVLPFLFCECSLRVHTDFIWTNGWVNILYYIYQKKLSMWFNAFVREKDWLPFWICFHEYVCSIIIK